MNIMLQIGAASVITFAPHHAAAQTLTTLHNFTLPPDASHPEQALLDVGGILYGTSYTGGSADRGSVYAVDIATGTETVLYSFAKTRDGAYPRSGLVQYGGILYGSTSAGGNATATAGYGTLFGINLSSGAETMLYNFPTPASGEQPTGAIAYHHGILYGTTLTGGDATCNCGTAFAFDLTTHTETVLHQFVGQLDGAGPFGGLLYAHGMLYGTTAGGGMADGGKGTIFAINPTSGQETVLYRFGNVPNDGESPLGSLIYKRNVLYGTTQIGGAHGAGTVFSFDTSTGTEKILYNFTNSTDGGQPAAGLVYLNGQLFGTTNIGGASIGGYGVIFKLNPSTGVETPLHVFTGSDGNDPAAQMTQVGATLYGTTNLGGTGCKREGCGTVFKLTLPYTNSP